MDANESGVGIGSVWSRRLGFGSVVNSALGKHTGDV